MPSRASTYLHSRFFLFSSISIRQFEVHNWMPFDLAFLHRLFMHALASQKAVAARASDTSSQANPTKSVRESSANMKRDMDAAINDLRR
jgi:hypothetical protein